MQHVWIQPCDVELGLIEPFAAAAAHVDGIDIQPVHVEFRVAAYISLVKQQTET